MTAPRPPRLRLGALDILGQRFSLLDDAGARHTVDTDAMRRARHRTSPLRNRLLIPHHEITHSFATFMVYMGVNMAIIVLFVTAMPTTGWPKIQGAIFRGVIAVVAVCAALMFTAARFRHRSNRYITLMKARALCPACIHSLEGLPVPDSGLVPCPECGAHWKFDHSTAPPGGLAKPAPASPPPL
jgi:hypothetical protein